VLLALINDAKAPDERSCKICNLAETCRVNGKDYGNERSAINLVNVLRGLYDEDCVSEADG
jgi:hypothetical protein